MIGMIDRQFHEWYLESMSRIRNEPIQTPDRRINRKRMREGVKSNPKSGTNDDWQSQVKFKLPCGHMSNHIFPSKQRIVFYCNDFYTCNHNIWYYIRSTKEIKRYDPMSTHPHYYEY